MNLKSCLKKVESNLLPGAPCLCDKKWADLTGWNRSAMLLTYCPKCKDRFEQWQRIAADAKTGVNLTDEVRI